MNNLGLSKSEIRKIIQKNLDQNADLVIGIDDPELVQLIDVLCDGIAFAIDKNNYAIQQALERHERDQAFRLQM